MGKYDKLDDHFEKPPKKGKGKKQKGRPVGSQTKFLARELSRYNRTHKEK